MNAAAVKPTIKIIICSVGAGSSVPDYLLCLHCKANCRLRRSSVALEARGLMDLLLQPAVSERCRFDARNDLAI